MKKSKIVIFCFSLLLITLFSCKDDNECLHNDDETEEVITKVTANHLEFAKILARALEDGEIRSFIKRQALLCVDNDYDVIYHYVKNEMMENGKTFRENLATYCNEGDINRLDKITDTDMTLTILVLYLENVFSAKTWNIENEVPSVACREDENKFLPTFNADGKMASLAKYTKPQTPVLVVKSNERLTTSSEKVTRSSIGKVNSISNTDGAFGYFIDEAFNNIQERKPHKATRTLSPDFQPEVYVNFDTSDKLFIASLSKEASSRDYVYYGISDVLGTTEGALDKDYRECITYIQFNDYGSLTHVNDLESQAADADWSDGNLEIVFDFSFITKDAVTSTLKKMISVSIDKLFDSDTKGTKIYYLPKPVEIFNWDLAKYGDTYRIDVSEYDNGTQTQSTSTVTSVYSSNFKSEASSSFFGLIKVGANYDYSDTTTKQGSTVITSTNNSDPLGSVFMNFFDPIYTNNKVYIGWVAIDLEIGAGCASFSTLTDRGLSGLNNLIMKIKNGLEREEIMLGNPFEPDREYYVEICNIINITSKYNLYSTDTGMITLGVEPRSIYK